MLATSLVRPTTASIKGEDGQAMAEYGIILALVAAVVIGVLVIFGQDIYDGLNSLISQL